MKTDIHPAYHPKATIKCLSCGTPFVVGSTVPAMEIEICSNCHPFYTGVHKFVDTAGRIDKFRARVERVKALRKKKTEPRDDRRSQTADSADSADSHGSQRPI